MTLPVVGFCNNASMSQLPVVIQGGMGAAVSNWRLAQAVSRTGQLGVVSSVALDTILSRRLQDGDPGGHMRRGLAMFPYPEIAERILDKHFKPRARRRARPYKLRHHAGAGEQPRGHANCWWQPTLLRWRWRAKATRTRLAST